MKNLTKAKHVFTQNKWFWWASVFLLLFLLYTAIFATGILLNPTLHIEQRLLLRPITGVDCVLRQWVGLGEVEFSLIFVLILSIFCLLLGYRRRIPVYFFLILLILVGIEYGGKQIFHQPIPDGIRHGLDSLDCPQIVDQSNSRQVQISLGLWWEASSIPQQRILDAQQSATTPYTFNDAPSDYDYPSGHGIRWCYIGLIAYWLIWKHLKPGKKSILRWLCMTLALVIAFGGGFAQFYIGFHLASDLLAGYLLGLSAACFSIGLLSQNEKRKKVASSRAPSPHYALL